MPLQVASSDVIGEIDITSDSGRIMHAKELLSERASYYSLNLEVGAPLRDVEFRVHHGRGAIILKLIALYEKTDTGWQYYHYGF